MMYLKIYIFQLSKNVQKLFHIHTGFNDFSFIWIVDGKIYDLFFIKIR